MNQLISRMERWIWYAFLVSLPWQTRLIVWQADSQFVEWRSAFLYASDVLMLSLFVLALLAVRGRLRAHIDTSDWLLALVFAAAALSLPDSRHISVSVYSLIRLLQYAVFYLYLRHWAWRRFDADISAAMFVAGAMGQAMLGIMQYLLQHDVGLRWLGETLLRTDMRGVAVFYDLAQHKILRAYGTLPHPNVLAAYLMPALGATVWLWLRHGTRSRRSGAVWQAVFSLLLIALYLTFARTVIAVAAVAGVTIVVLVYCNRFSGAWKHIVEVRRRLRVVLLTAIVISAGVLLLLWPQMVARLTISSSDEAVRQRIQYNNDALASGRGWSLDVNWTGVGIGAFTTWLAEFDRTLPPHAVQPAHNIFLLAYSEIGVVGLAVWLAWLAGVFAVARNAYRGQPLVRASIIALAASFVLIGLLDHFFWTLQQGRLLWWGVLALAVGETRR